MRGVQLGGRLVVPGEHAGIPALGEFVEDAHDLDAPGGIHVVAAEPDAGGRALAGLLQVVERTLQRGAARLVIAQDAAARAGAGAQVANADTQVQVGGGARRGVIQRHVDPLHLHLRGGEGHKHGRRYLVRGRGRAGGQILHGGLLGGWQIHLRGQVGHELGLCLPRDEYHREEEDETAEQQEQDSRRRGGYLVSRGRLLERGLRPLRHLDVQCHNREPEVCPVTRIVWPATIVFKKETPPNLLHLCYRKSRRVHRARRNKGLPGLLRAAPTKQQTQIETA